MTALQRLGIIAALIVASGFTGWIIGNSHGAAKASAKAQAAQAESDKHEGASQTHAAQAAASDRQAMENRSAVHAADTLAVAAKRGLDDALAALPNKPPASISSWPRTPMPHASAPADLKGKQVSPRSNAEWGLSSVPEIPENSNYPEIPDSSQPVSYTYKLALDKAQAVIAAQDAQIAARDKLIASLTASRDEWKASAEEAQKALALEKLASDARAAAQSKRTVWTSIKTGVVSAALGYAVAQRR